MSSIFQHRWYFFSIGLVSLSCIQARLLFFLRGVGQLQLCETQKRKPEDTRRTKV